MCLPVHKNRELFNCRNTINYPREILHYKVPQLFKLKIIMLQ